MIPVHLFPLFRKKIDHPNSPKLLLGKTIMASLIALKLDTILAVNLYE